MKFAYQGIPGSYSESCIKENYPDCEKTISCRTFQDAFELAKNNNINHLKILLANEATAMLHGKSAAKKAEQTAKKTFDKKTKPLKCLPSIIMNTYIERVL